MGKPDKNQPKITFPQTRSQAQHTDPGGAPTPPTSEHEQQDIKSLLLAMEKGIQTSINSLGAKIDALTYRMDRMGERLDKQAERTDMAERRITEVEEAQTAMDANAKQLDNLMRTLRDKTEDLEARSRRSNLRIIGLPESTQTGNMERYVEKLLTDLLGAETFSNVFIVERAHRSLGPRPRPGAPPRPIIAKLLNYRDRDAALRVARERQVLSFEGSTLSLYPDFTAQVQEARRHFVPMKRQLKEMGLEYAMLYPARLRVRKQNIDHVFTDPQTLKKALQEWKREKRTSPERLEREEQSESTLAEQD